MHLHLPLVTVVADAPLAGDQYGSEPVGLVYPVFLADIFRVGCAMLVWESGMHSHGNRRNKVTPSRLWERCIN